MIRRVAAVLGGFFLGSFVFMILQSLVSMQFPPPEGFNVNDKVALFDYFEKLPDKMFIFLTLAHSISALIGATIGALISDKYKTYMGMLVGVMILAAAMVYIASLPVPSWMIIVDPIAILLGAFIGTKLLRSSK